MHDSWLYLAGALAAILGGIGLTYYRLARDDRRRYALARCEVGGSVGSWAAAEQICPQPAGQGIIAICPAQHIVAVPSAQCIADGPYAGMNISGVTGISPAQKAALKALGAVEIAP